MSTLEIKNLHASVLPLEEGQEPTPILKGVNLTINSGETHAIMGPNGSGKSTLAYTLSGHPSYEVTDGEVLLDGENILDMEVDERARAGLFLAMQYPVEVPGVSSSNFMRSAVTAVRGEAPKLREWVQELNQARDDLKIDPSFSERAVNEGFSGGEKKRHEVMQLALMKPKFAVMDETDSGLDVDALRIVSEGINRYQQETDGGILMITHYQRILNYVRPDHVHIFADGVIKHSGGFELAEKLESEGYEAFI
ncbi:Fe-S cluster assembly ATPase SufC [Corynebacterium sp. CCUG 70398]|uniref:Fe-S cluster assembly ATPase SufC n=1 Tax=Corynebacterium sp. CCUG 70398 TaxID=2823891 RepID=UPI00210BEA60|nr:Fe-S cluster assembly ATPase SufC [Corynebacterium sp. CCUG 70398]MCQ4622177.1 Fe-S cluster assembly ATPase SufC [Corynebacterium sp. CCUG 70398]